MQASAIKIHWGKLPMYVECAVSVMEMTESWAQPAISGYIDDVVALKGVWLA